MIRAPSSAGNFIHKDSKASLVVVKVNSEGKPDSVSYWKNPGQPVKSGEKNYTAGALVDIWV